MKRFSLGGKKPEYQTHPPVAGFCPRGCGATLHLLDRRIVCLSTMCPQPNAVDILLSDRESEHVVDLNAYEFTVRHPLRERINDELLNCELHHHLREMDRPPHQAGRYRVTWTDGDWAFAPID
jgi:hypothetical protein